jgi:hypothetical protein
MQEITTGYQRYQPIEFSKVIRELMLNDLVDLGFIFIFPDGVLFLALEISI